MTKNDKKEIKKFEIKINSSFHINFYTVKELFLNFFSISLKALSVALPIYLAIIANSIANYSAPLQYSYNDSNVILDLNNSIHPSISFKTTGTSEFTIDEDFSHMFIEEISNANGITINSGSIENIQYFFFIDPTGHSEQVMCKIDEVQLYTFLNDYDRSNHCSFYPYSDTPPYSNTYLKHIITTPKYPFEFFDVFIVITDKNNNKYIDFMRIFAGINTIKVTEHNMNSVPDKCQQTDSIPSNYFYICLNKSGLKISLKEYEMIDPKSIINANKIISKYCSDFMFHNDNSYIPGKTISIDPTELNEKRLRLIQLLEEQKLY
jgi:hypothetical protein